MRREDNKKRDRNSYDCQSVPPGPVKDCRSRLRVNVGEGQRGRLARRSSSYRVPGLPDLYFCGTAITISMKLYV